jgi:hypothetical protein
MKLAFERQLFGWTAWRNRDADNAGDFVTRTSPGMKLTDYAYIGRLEGCKEYYA